MTLRPYDDENFDDRKKARDKLMDPDRDDNVEHARKRGHMRNSDRGFHTKDMHEAAEAMRMKGEGSEDPIYPNSKKNR